VHHAKFNQEAKENGYMCSHGPVALAPFDIISDMLRGMRGTMLDMFQVPEKLLAAQEKLLPLVIGLTMQGIQITGNPRVFIPLHRGADGFMSPKQFEKFYWPFLKQVIQAITDAGFVACPFFEGMYDQRLEYLTELPHGKVIAIFDRSEMKRVKEVIGGKLCIAGGMPITPLSLYHVFIAGREGLPELHAQCSWVHRPQSFLPVRYLQTL
jgi:hypothetical protein